MPTRDEAIAIIARGHDEVRDLLAGLPLEQLEEPATIGGGEWSAKDLIGHLTSWEEIALASIDEWRTGARPAIEDTFAAGGVDALNADDVARKSVLPVTEVLRRFDEVQARLAAALQDLPAEEWERQAPYPDPDDPSTTLGSLIGTITGTTGGPFDHVSAHVRDLRAFSTSRGPD